MGETYDSQHQAIDPLCLDRSPDCGYLLTGLPESGVCPECGFEYRPDMIVVYGRATGLHTQAANVRAGRLGWIASQSLSGVLLVLIAGVMTGNLRFTAAFASLAAGYVLIAGLCRRHSLEQSPAPVQLRLFPGGFAQRNGIGPIKRLRPWRLGKRVHIRPRGQGRHRIRSWRIVQVQRTNRAYDIDMEFECSDIIVETIRQRIERWRGACADAKEARSTGPLHQTGG